MQWSVAKLCSPQVVEIYCTKHQSKLAAIFQTSKICNILQQRISLFISSFAAFFKNMVRTVFVVETKHEHLYSILSYCNDQQMIHWLEAQSL